MLEKWFAGRHDWAPVPLRLSLGVIFFAHGAQKVTQTLHIPAPLAVLAFLAEFLGGIALLVGGFTRWVALLLAGEMFVAALLAHLRNGFFLNWTNAPNAGHGIEYNVALVGATLALVMTGGGKFSLDKAVKK